jgi:hypothetical protein
MRCGCFVFVALSYHRRRLFAIRRRRKDGVKEKNFRPQGGQLYSVATGLAGSVKTCRICVATEPVLPEERHRAGDVRAYAERRVLRGPPRRRAVVAHHTGWSVATRPSGSVLAGALFAEGSASGTRMRKVAPRPLRRVFIRPPSNATRSRMLKSPTPAVF